MQHRKSNFSVSRLSFVLGLYLVMLGRHYYLHGTWGGSSELWASPGMPSSPATNSPHYMNVNLIWTGNPLTGPNLDAIREFRKKFAEVSMIHFVNPVYFIGDDKTKNLELIKSVVQPQDQYAMYLMPHEAMLGKLGIALRYSPNLWGGESDCTEVCARSVSLESFNEGELNQMIDFGKVTLESTLGTKIQAFMSHDWNSSEKLAQILESHQFHYSFNAIPPDHVKNRLEGFPVYSYVKDRWGKISSETPVFREKSSPITYVPQTGGAIDYVNANDLKAIFTKLAKANSSAQTRAPQVFTMSAFSDTFVHNRSRLAKAMQLVQAEIKNLKTNTQYLPNPLNIEGSDPDNLDSLAISADGLTKGAIFNAH